MGHDYPVFFSSPTIASLTGFSKGPVDVSIAFENSSNLYIIKAVSFFSWMNFYSIRLADGKLGDSLRARCDLYMHTATKEEALV